MKARDLETLLLETLLLAERERSRIRYALSAGTVVEMAARLTYIADFYDPADEWLLEAARVLAAACPEAAEAGPAIGRDDA